jgi:hypothetical protein
VWAINIERLTGFHRLRFVGHAINDNDLCIYESTNEKMNANSRHIFAKFSLRLNKTGLASFCISMNKRIKGTFKLFRLIRREPAL